MTSLAVIVIPLLYIKNLLGFSFNVFIIFLLNFESPKYPLTLSYRILIFNLESFNSLKDSKLCLFLRTSLLAVILIKVAIDNFTKYDFEEDKLFSS